VAEGDARAATGVEESALARPDDSRGCSAVGLVDLLGLARVLPVDLDRALVGGVVANRGGHVQAAVVRPVVVDDLDVEHVHVAGGVDDDVRDDLAPDLALRVVVVAHGSRGDSIYCARAYSIYCVKSAT
jgi:hypothetical protein